MSLAGRHPSTDTSRGRAYAPPNSPHVLLPAQPQQSLLPPREPETMSTRAIPQVVRIQFARSFCASGNRHLEGAGIAEGRLLCTVTVGVSASAKYTAVVEPLGPSGRPATLTRAEIRLTSFGRYGVA